MREVRLHEMSGAVGAILFVGVGAQEKLDGQVVWARLVLGVAHQIAADSFLEFAAFAAFDLSLALGSIRALSINSKNQKHNKQNKNQPFFTLTRSQMCFAVFRRCELANSPSHKYLEKRD